MTIITTPYKYNDGGRKDAGYKGEAGDCVVRAIAIATQKPYKEVYSDLFKLNKIKNKPTEDSSPRNGRTSIKIIKQYLKDFGWKWTPTMFIGSGCKVHLCKEELPAGRLIVRLSKHITAVIDGVIKDTHQPARGGTRCVYGYWSK